jgi:hypothetical protein
MDVLRCQETEGSETPSGSCSANADCSAGEYCKTPAGNCGDVGECATRPGACFDVVEPVCGCDGETYGNACYAEVDGVSVGGDCDE